MDGAGTRKRPAILHKISANPAYPDAEYRSFKWRQPSNAMAARTNVVKDRKLPLGRQTGYPDKYAPEVLCAISRADSREPLGLCWRSAVRWGGHLECVGADLARRGRPSRPSPQLRSLCARGLAQYYRIEIPEAVPEFVCDEPVSHQRTEVAQTIARDLSVCAGRDTRVVVLPLISTEARCVSRDWPAPAWTRCRSPAPTGKSLPTCCKPTARRLLTEDLHTHLLRSLCPVTSQPDIGSLQISYRGPRIDPASLLRYIVSYRQHNDFHEACIERMFVDLMARCAPVALSIHARYQRRGGMDINPFRSNNETDRPFNLRLWRQ